MNSEVSVEVPFHPRETADVFDITSEAASGLCREPSQMTLQSYNSETPGSEVFGELVSSINYKRSVFSFNNKKRSQFSGLDTDTIDEETEDDSRSECHDTMREIHNTVNCLIKDRRGSVDSTDSLPVEIIQIGTVSPPQGMDLITSSPTSFGKPPRCSPGSVTSNAWSLCSSLPMEEFNLRTTEFGAGTKSHGSSGSSLAAEVVELPPTKLFCPLSKTVPGSVSIAAASSVTTPEDAVLSPSFLKDKNAIARYGSCILAHCAHVEEEGSMCGSPLSPLSPPVSPPEWQDCGGGVDDVVMICDLPIAPSCCDSEDHESLEAEVMTFG